jgi:endonuclease YncB( thermonuclease family)
MTRKIYTVLLVAATAAVAAVAPPAEAHKTRCTSDPGSPRCHVWYGKVKLVADGDTIDVDLYGDHSRERARIRLTGINAPELHRYSHYANRRRGECHGVAATNRLESLIRRGHWRVRIAAQHPRSHSGARLRRQISVKVAGHWIDLNRTMLEEGRALFLGNNEEWAWNRRYQAVAEEASARGEQIWNPRGCGAGPAADIAPTMHLKYDAVGNDYQNVNGEWVRIFNPTDAPLALDRWWFRDSWKERYYFPDWAQIPAHGSVLLRMGHGQNGGGVFHWGRPTPPFENPRPHRGKSGDGGYLFDPRGNLRAWVIYPCVASFCASLRVAAGPLAAG